MKDARDFAATHQITHIERASTNLQDSITASFTIPTSDRTHAMLSKRRWFLVFSCLEVITNPHCGMVCVGPPKFQGNKSSADDAFQVLQGAAGSPQSCCQRRQLWIFRDADWDADLCACVILCQLFALRIIAVHWFLKSSLVHLIPTLFRSQRVRRHVNQSVRNDADRSRSVSGGDAA